MSQRVRQVPHAAFVEEYDEDANVALPETRQVANVAAKRSKSELRTAELGFDFASDSGYSSRTAATVNSVQSPPSGRRSPVPLRLDTTPRLTGTERHRESRKDKGKERDDRHADIMQYDSVRNASRMAPSPRSPSKPRRRDSVSVRHPPGTCWECEQGLYHPSTPMEPRAIEYPPYYYSQPPPPPPAPSVHDIPSSPKSARYPHPFVQDVHVSHGAHGQRRMSRSYHDNGRPFSFHAGMPDVMYNPMSMSPYEHGPPPSASAFANLPPVPQPPYSQQPQYYHDQGPDPQAIYERPQASSKSRHRERSRRGSIYGPPVVEYASPPSVYDGEAPLERRSSREHRPRPPSQSLDLDEDYYRMPPPPPPPPPPAAAAPAPKSKSKSKPPLQIIQPRKSATTGGGRRPSQSSFDMSDLEATLPDRPIRQFSDSRAPLLPERSHSLKSHSRKNRRITTYHESDRSDRSDRSEESAQSAIEDSRRRRVSYYEDEDDRRSDLKSDLEKKHRSAEEYQAARSGKTVPLTTDALLKAKMSQRAESDSGSQKSGSNSSRGSDARTRDGSGVGSKYDDENNITMTMNGVTMTLDQNAIGGKRIHLRTGEEGAVQLNIEGRRPRKYLTAAAHSDYSSVSGRREHEDARRTRDDRRSDRASRRSSRSVYGGRFD
ncbi:hypothetical protein VTN77DRAFT_1638 [Rasamsonia byssochlamydoides]|uniref:uncharacterized protein n=1 Tax=Rasamsonia byssochlamydoides TaxID=89139 RepID=UPI003743DFBB